MSVIKTSAILFILGGMCCFFYEKGISPTEPVAGQNIPLTISLFQEKEGYRDIAACQDHFILAGTYGRVDIMLESGEITPVTTGIDVQLNAVICDKDGVIIAGNNGTILISEDGERYRQISCNTDEDINDITFFNGILIAAADNGTIVIPGDAVSHKILQLPLKGNIVSVSADNSICYGVTDKGEIIRSTDGKNWNIFDYNSEYEGYSEPCSFSDILIAEDRIGIIGSHDDGTPAVLFSSLGNVWTERTLNYTNEEGLPRILTNLPNDICYDPYGIRFFLACDNGMVLSLPSCTKCNESFTVADRDLEAIMCTGNTLMAIGADYTVNAHTIR